MASWEPGCSLLFFVSLPCLEQAACGFTERSNAIEAWGWIELIQVAKCMGFEE